VVSILIALVDQGRSTKKSSISRQHFSKSERGMNVNWIKFRAGRHELEYGSGRLIDVREGPNVRLSFDGFQGEGQVSVSWQIDGFAVRSDLDKPGFFDKRPKPRCRILGRIRRPTFDEDHHTGRLLPLASIEKQLHSTGV